MSGNSIVEFFARQVRIDCNQVAVRHNREPVSYGALNCHANRIAHYILAIPDDHPGRPVAVMAQRGPSQVAAILGVLKSGHPYVPLDPAQPADRLKTILSDSDCRVLLTDTGCAARIHAPDGVYPVTNVEDLDSSLSIEDPDVVIDSDAPAYLLYTSGSSGRPKAVFTSHRVVVHNALDLIEAFDLRPGVRAASFLAPAHGLSTSLLFQTLLCGGTLLPFDLAGNGLRALATWLRDEQINLVKATPSVIRRLVMALAPGETFPSLQYLWLGGEPLYRDDVERLRPLLWGNYRIISAYSSTETKNLCRLIINTDTVLPPGLVSVGTAVNGKRIRVVDDNGNEVAPGETGEILAQSRYLSGGYWRDPGLTRERFLEVAGSSTEKIFRTGDMGRIRPEDGTLELCGRRDGQLKIRGFRVQPEEVTAALRRVNGIVDAAVIVNRTGDQPAMAAYVVPGSTEINAETIRRHLTDLVPDYLVPSSITLVRDLPHTSIGKLDVEALRVITPTSHAASHQPNYSRTQLIILSAMRRILRDDSIGAQGDFFAAGGDSLAAATLLAQIEHMFQARIPITDFARNPNSGWLADQVDQLRANPAPENQPPDQLLVPLATSGSGTPLYLVPGGGGGEVELFLAYADLAEALGHRRPVYGFRATTPDGRLAAGKDVATIVAGFTRELRSFQPVGPYVLLGGCYGGLVAMAMADQLRKGGDSVSLVLLDTPVPRYRPYIWRRINSTVNRLRGLAAAVYVRLRHHREQSSNLSWHRKFRYLLNRLRPATSLVREHGRKSFHPVESVSQRIIASREAYKKILLDYRPRTCTGPLTVILSEGDYLRQGVDTDWKRYCGDKARIITTPGDHHSAVRAHARELAKRILESLPDQGEGAGMACWYGDTSGVQ